MDTWAVLDFTGQVYGYLGCSRLHWSGIWILGLFQTSLVRYMDTWAVLDFTGQVYGYLG